MAKQPRVGRGYPPKERRYRKGQSGNPKGRPIGSKNLSTILMEAAGDQVTANIGGRPRKITKLQATAMQLATKAAAGDQKAIGKFLDWIDEIERRAAAARPPAFPFSPHDLDVLHETHKRMSQRASSQESNHDASHSDRTIRQHLAE